MKDVVKKSWFTIPFVSKISYKFKDIIKDLDVDLAFFNLNKLNVFIKTHKDSLLNKTKKNVIQDILQGLRCQADRENFKEQESWNIVMTSEESNHSVVTKHRLDLNHDFFDWEGTEIVDHERFLYK